MASIGRNAVANFIGSGWAALAGFVFVPFYVHFLGIESYGLVGLFATLQICLTVFESGLPLAVTRELATVDAVRGSEKPLTIFKTTELLYFCGAAAIAAAIFGLASWIADTWLKSEGLSKSELALVVGEMGIVVSLRLVVGLYRAALVGLQDQVWLNAATVLFSTARGGVSIFALAFIAPSIEVFFAAQGVVTIFEGVAYWIRIRWTLPTPDHPVRFQLSSLRGISRFLTQMAALTALSLALTQGDKIMLSAGVVLSSFGYYMLATTVASSLTLLVTPISTAAFPRFSALIAHSAFEELRSTYHAACQWANVLAITFGIPLALFSREILLLWTRDETVAQSSHEILSWLAAGFTLNAVLTMPLNLQLATGHAGVVVKLNLVAALLALPGYYLAIETWGSVGAAMVWFGYNAVLFFIWPYLLHRTVLKTELWRWYKTDVLPPLLGAAGAGLAVKAIAGRVVLSGMAADAVFLAAAVLASGAVAVVLTPKPRTRTVGALSVILRRLR